MKKITSIILLMLSLLSYSQDIVVKDTIIKEPAKEKVVKEKLWRTLTLTNLGGVTLSGHYLNTFSVSVDYGLKNNWSISSWSGVNYNKSYNGGWISTSLSLQKVVKKVNLGLGVMYGSGNINTPLPDKILQTDIAVTFSISKRFKLD